MQCGVFMEDKQLKWCFSLKDGLRISDSNEILAKSYLQEAKSSLQRAEKDFKDKDLLWATVVIYYAEYYSLYSFLQRIGIKCENHLCSILAVSSILGEEKVRTINLHKKKRLDAQYYMKTGKEEEVGEMLRNAKIFVAMFDELVSNLTEKEIKIYKEKLI